MKEFQIASGCKYEKDLKHQKIIKVELNQNIFDGLRVKEAQRNRFIPSRKKIHI